VLLVMLQSAPHHIAHLASPSLVSSRGQRGKASVGKALTTDQSHCGSTLEWHSGPPPPSTPHDHVCARSSGRSGGRHGRRVAFFARRWTSSSVLSDASTNSCPVKREVRRETGQLSMPEARRGIRAHLTTLTRRSAPLLASASHVTQHRIV
jgi:hypothetical protein